MTEMLTRPPESQDAQYVPLQNVPHLDKEILANQPDEQRELTLPAVAEEMSRLESNSERSDSLTDDERYKLSQMRLELEAGGIPDELKLKRDFNEGSKAHDLKQLAAIEKFKAGSDEVLGKHQKAEAAAAVKEAANQQAADWNAERDVAREQAKTKQDMLDKELYKVQLQIGEKRLNADKDKYRAEAVTKVNEKLGITPDINITSPTVTEQQTAAAEKRQASLAEELRNFDKGLAKAATEKQLLKDVEWSTPDNPDTYESPLHKAIDEKLVEAENRYKKAKALNDQAGMDAAYEEMNKLEAEEDKLDADLARITQLEAERDELEAKLANSRPESDESLEADSEEVAEQSEPIRDTSEIGLKKRFTKVFTNAGAELGKFRADPKEYFALSKEGVSRRRKLAAVVLGGAAIITAAVLVNKNMMSGEEVSTLAAGTEAPVDSTALNSGDELRQPVAAPVAEVVAAAEVAQSFTEAAMQSGDNPWNMAEQTLIERGIPRPSIVEIDALKDSIMELNGLDDDEAKNLKPGFKLKIPR